MSAPFRTFAQVQLYVFTSHLDEGAGIGVKNALMQKCGPIGATLEGATLLRDDGGGGGSPLPSRYD